MSGIISEISKYANSGEINFKIEQKQEAMEALKDYFGFNNFKGQQEEIVENILNRKNSFVIMPTGGGKSLCYQLPALMMDGTAIIVSPLIALMKDQVDSLTRQGIAAAFVNSSLDSSAIDDIFIRLGKGELKLFGYFFRHTC